MWCSPGVLVCFVPEVGMVPSAEAHVWTDVGIPVCAIFCQFLDEDPCSEVRTGDGFSSHAS